jgi:dTDP-L-rhamnose 4-epimerase
MKILVTGGAGFIGSHTCDRLLSLGHEVTVLDALTQPVHRNGRPAYLTPSTDFYQGDTRNRELVTNLLRRVNAVYHFADYRDYLPDFSRFSDVNVVSTALLYEIIVAERLDLARVVVASSQAAMGEGLYWCPVDGEQTPGMRPESVFAARRWDIPCPVCGGPMELRATPETVSNPQNAYGMSKLAEEMIAINLGRRYGIPTVALRYSIVQGPRQSVYNAYSGACRIFCLSYLLGKPPVLYEDGEAIRDYVNIEDVVDANVLALWDDRAAGRVFNVGGGQAVTTREFADIVMRQYGSDQPGIVTGEYRFGDTRHILSDISALRVLGWEPRRTPSQSVAAYAAWLEDMDGLDGVLAEADARMRALGVVRKAASRRPSCSPRHDLRQRDTREALWTSVPFRASPVPCCSGQSHTGMSAVSSAAPSMLTWCARPDSVPPRSSSTACRVRCAAWCADCTCAVATARRSWSDARTARSSTSSWTCVPPRRHTATGRASNCVTTNRSRCTCPSAARTGFRLSPTLRTFPIRSIRYMTRPRTSRSRSMIRSWRSRGRFPSRSGPSGTGRRRH